MNSKYGGKENMRKKVLLINLLGNKILLCWILIFFWCVCVLFFLRETPINNGRVLVCVCSLVCFLIVVVAHIVQEDEYSHISRRCLSRQTDAHKHTHADNRRNKNRRKDLYFHLKEPFFTLSSACFWAGVRLLLSSVFILCVI